jgi:hypothetical protein
VLVTIDSRTTRDRGHDRRSLLKQYPRQTQPDVSRPAQKNNVWFFAHCDYFPMSVKT